VKIINDFFTVITKYNETTFFYYKMLIKYAERLKQINYHIKQHGTGTPKEFAKKLGITERSWYKLRDSLIHDLGLPIAYCHIKRTYYYTEDGSFEIGFRKITNDKKSKIAGGSLYSCNYYALNSA
jgi:predicted DNA-binding transcriptional regulator YafY